jgi:hypothetical protein
VILLINNNFHNISFKIKDIRETLSNNIDFVQEVIGEAIGNESENSDSEGEGKKLSSPIIT